MKFKVGDRVKALVQIDFASPGTIGVIASVDTSPFLEFPYRVDFECEDGDRWPTRENEIERAD